MGHPHTYGCFVFILVHIWKLDPGRRCPRRPHTGAVVTTKLRINVEGTLQAAKLERDRSGVPALPRKKGGAAIPAMLPGLACANAAALTHSMRAPADPCAH